MGRLFADCDINANTVLVIHQRLSTRMNTSIVLILTSVVVTTNVASRRLKRSQVKFTPPGFAATTQTVTTAVVTETISLPGEEHGDDLTNAVITEKATKIMTSAEEGNSDISYVPAVKKASECDEQYSFGCFFRKIRSSLIRVAKTLIERTKF